MKKSLIITITIILAVIIFAVIMRSNMGNGTQEQTAICIGKNSVVYIQLGCHACESQEKLFGDTYKYINEVDCFYEREKCSNEEIRVTPTWVINEQKYEGVQSIEKLKELTGCD